MESVDIFSVERPFQFTGIKYNNSNPEQSKVILKIDGENVELDCKIKDTSTISVPPQTAIWNPETKVIEDAYWLQFRPFAIPYGYQRLTFYDMCKFSYESENKIVNYYVYESYLKYVK